MQELTGKKILLGISGSIAAYKSCELVRLLSKEGADVEVVMTESATNLVGPVTFEALSKKKVWTNLWNNPAQPIPHIDLQRGKDLFLIAPATANLIAKIATGIADDLMTSTVSARTCPLMIAPAMNIHMWQSKPNQRNVELLKQDGIVFSGPVDGSQACGDVGAGRFKEPHEILEDVISFFTPKVLCGKTVLMTAGPTFESIDPVRGITNRSSGRQGFDIAKYAQRAGATVYLVAGPTSQETPPSVNRYDVLSTEEMLDKVEELCKDVKPDLFIAVAAVSDFKSKTFSEEKIKKVADVNEMTLTLVKNPDILATVAAMVNGPLCIGFAAESENLINYARSKLERKKVRMIVANSVSAIDKADNDATFVFEDHEEPLGKMSKEELANKIVQKAAELLKAEGK